MTKHLSQPSEHDVKGIVPTTHSTYLTDVIMTKQAAAVSANPPLVLRQHLRQAR